MGGGWRGEWAGEKVGEGGGKMKVGAWGWVRGVGR